MNPYQHGEVYVTDDEILEFGHYERFIMLATSQDSNVTTEGIQ